MLKVSLTEILYPIHSIKCLLCAEQASVLKRDQDNADIPGSLEGAKLRPK